MGRSAFCRPNNQDTGSGRPRRRAPTLGEAISLTHQERENETIRRLREHLAARQESPRPQWLIQAAGPGQLIQLDEVAEMIYEIQS